MENMNTKKEILNLLDHLKLINENAQLAECFGILDIRSMLRKIEYNLSMIKDCVNQSKIND